MNIMYRSYGQEIEKLEVVRETDKSVFYLNWRGKESRDLKQSTYQNWFNTWEEAHQFLIEKAKKAVSAQERNLEYAKRELSKVMQMKKDE